MRRASFIFVAWLAFGGSPGCAPGGAPTPDAGTTPLGDAGGCGASCVAPDAGECLDANLACSDGGLACCPGFECLDGTCAPTPSPCPDGGQLFPSGCGCDPTLGPNAGCGPGLVCGSDLQCELDAGVPVVLVAQPVGAPCEPLVTYPDGGPAPSCAQPVAPDGGPDAGANGGPAGSDAGPGTIDCVPDPSGVYLYVCAQACDANSDCPLAWQTCNSPYAAPGHCGDDPCTPFNVTKGFFAPCPDGGGLCLPFAALVASNGAAGAVAENYGLCLQDADAGPNDACADPPSRLGPLCDSEQLCVLGHCRSPCNAAAGALPDAGSCLASEVCAPLGVQPVVPGALFATGGCVNPCELDGGDCDAGVVDAGADAGDAGGGDAGDAGEDAGPDGGALDDGGSDGGLETDGGDGG